MATSLSKMCFSYKIWMGTSLANMVALANLTKEHRPLMATESSSEMSSGEYP